MRIAILEDEAAQAEIVQSILQNAGHDCTVYSSGKALQREVGRESYDMFILDWQVPDLSGDEVLRWIRSQVAAPIPVMFVTNRDGEEDIVTALANGADDYMRKPISRGELIARVTALLRRAYPKSADEVHEFAPYRFESKTNELSIDGTKIELTQKEFDLALFMFQNLGRLLSRGHILEAVWGRTTEVPSRTMDTHISRIRTKLSLRPEQGFKLTPVYNYGYRLEQIVPANVQGKQ